MGGQAPNDDSTGVHALTVITPFFSLGLVIFILRMYTRIIPAYKLHASDYLITIAVVAEIITYSLFAAAVANGFGRHNEYISPASSIAILKCLFGVMITGLWASTFARLSIACLLHSFSMSRSWKMALWFIMGFQIVALAASETFQLLECRPVRAMWEPVVDAKCMPTQKVWVIGYVFVGASMFSDLVLTILPIFLIWKLSRSVVERCLVSVLMGLSVFATITTVLKIVYMKTFDIDSPDIFRATMPLFLWCRMEECLIMTAASAPLLKAPVESVLTRLGFPTFHNSVRHLNSWDSIRTPEHHITGKDASRGQRYEGEHRERMPTFVD
ncbi:hypothetical protein FOXG_15610 [Fusarium oxysporum f. sp. lycopersici 4287]|uniref:Rhodopsin domain-containing protein n=1 Tax=Fusarium oxysporum f. sp. lycopersici (strain 4287 / CBS 123668 / FGSC 9935 / NRRL 34936) TaxID=426428 RepID=A0A0J9W4V9_FUSO4|nr:hypothetical protein FOXG_15610 [Fusarium oxysporum f. sp. lycopersici 4287]XP_018255944.1 hypothetical protein FOXG_15610 [Fusarium oxysporum f. sp. lycopersici 4287]XP_018255945.1 hypothetical protein FOXG_15610 [Fusarium oxysporum f. sp. lycopersici 4287]KAJ9419944.1 hypothetical protein QL093DRAFT_2375736 [Fusarium oxysporum]KNB17898.1 hypothetical protein FOXG_15610 [Fusarium oxysporum f. sp. lycopersici 4287]KNB17899.1 hypothetical protein FOXG_15610 [Fusarium oxysporum f. sp. lycoper